MLVLRRKRRERVRINDDIVIEVRETSTGAVKLGIEAPADCVIWRDEIYEREKLRQESRSA